MHPVPAGTVEPVTFHQTSPSQGARFRRTPSQSKRAGRSGPGAGEHGRCVAGGMEGGDGSSVSLLEELLDVSLDVAGEEPPAVALEGNPVRPHQELLEVPGHVVPADGAPDDQLGVVEQRGRLVAGERQLLPQEHEERVGVLAVHVHLLQELELWLEAVSRTDVLQGQENFFILAILL